MCLIIYKPKGVELQESTLRGGYSSNPHGAGLMYSVDGKLVVEKGYFQVDAVVARVKYISETYPDSHICVHFRLATSGNQDRDNCHPFNVNEELAVMHNGIFGKYSDYQSTKSDTWLFTEQMLQQLKPTFLQDTGTRFLLEKYCRSELSKLVFMNKEGDVDIVNEKAGSWKAGCWFSSGYYGYSYGNYSGGSTDAWSYDNSNPNNTNMCSVWLVCGVCGEYQSTCMDIQGERICDSCWNARVDKPKYCAFCGHSVIFDTELVCPICHTENNLYDVLYQNDKEGNE